MKRNGELELQLNSKNAPELRLSRTYVDMLEAYSNSKNKSKHKETLTFVKQKIDSAKWFIDAIRQRQNTLHVTIIRPVMLWVHSHDVGTTFTM